MNMGISDGDGTRPRAEAHSKRWEVIAAFSFGCVFVVVILLVAVFLPNPTPFAYTVFRITIALAAAGVGAVLPGFLDVRLKNWLRAGGALALFVVVYFFAPVAASPADPPLEHSPADSAHRAALEWLDLLDKGDYAKTYAEMASMFRQAYPLTDFQNLVGRERSVLGEVRSRDVFSSQQFESPPGAPKGHYRQVVYRTTFASEKQTLYEMVMLFAEDQKWRANGYFMVIRTPTGQFAPYDRSATQQLSPGNIQTN